MGSKMKQDKGRGSERPSVRATPPRNAGREAGLRDFHCGDHRWSVDPRLAVKGGRVNMQTRIIAGFFGFTCGGHLGGLRHFQRADNFHFRFCSPNDNFLITLRLWDGYPHRLLVWCVLAGGIKSAPLKTKKRRCPYG